MLVHEQHAVVHFYATEMFLDMQIQKTARTILPRSPYLELVGDKQHCLPLHCPADGSVEEVSPHVGVHGTQGVVEE